MTQRLQARSTASGDPGGESARYDCVVAAWRANERELRGFLVNRLGGAGDGAEDLLQEVFLRAMREGEGFCRLDNPRAWLMRVARNAAIDHLRRQRPTEDLPEVLPAEEDTTAPLDALTTCLERNLVALAEPDRDIVRRCDLEGASRQTYARERGLSVAAVKTRLFRARKRLREQLVRNCRVRFDDAGRVCCHEPPPQDRG